MQMQVSTDRNVEGSGALSAWVSAEVRQWLGRLSRQITPFEVHLSDEKAGKSDAFHKRCLIEARLERLQPIAASKQGPTIEDAFTGAAKKPQRVPATTLGKLRRTARRRSEAAISRHQPVVRSQFQQTRRRNTMAKKNSQTPASQTRPEARTSAESVSLGSKRDKAEATDRSSDDSPDAGAIDWPGFDLGGSTGKVSAGTGLGLGTDAAENRHDRSLRGRRGKRT